jgi:hypothetical protein
MEIELSKVIISAIAGLISGVIGSLVAPWINWRIENKKLTRKSREDLIRSAREALEKDDLSNNEFRHLPIYSRIKPYLSEQAVKAVEGEFSNDGPLSREAVRIVLGDGRNSGLNPFKNKVLDELTLLEKKWGLI